MPTRPSRNRLNNLADLERNKANVKAFYELAFTGGQPRKAVETYVGGSYIQHNPHVANGTEGFIAYFERMAEQYPDKSIRFVRCIAEGDLVTVHTHQLWPGSDDYASMDIFRCDDTGKIVEHWDVLQVIPADMAHDNGMF